MNRIDPIAPWQPLGQPPPEALRDARLQAHWAAQVLAAVGRTHVEPEADEGHLASQWLEGPAVLAGEPFGGAFPLQVALRLRDLTVLVLDENATPITAYGLHGRTLAEALAWLEQVIADCTGTRRRKLRRPAHPMPAHPVGEEGATFTVTDPAAFEELGRWFSNGYHAVQAVSTTLPGATLVRCWPEHLDLQSLILRDPWPDGTAVALGVSLIPGDGTFEAPYWCVELTPTPPPEAELPELADGSFWHRDEWIGVVLPGRDVVHAGDAPQQAARVAAFWNAALDACETLLATWKAQRFDRDTDAPEKTPDAST